MTQRRRQILIAENEFFIAMDAERAVRELLDCEISLCRRDHLDDMLAHSQRDLVLVEAGATFQECCEQAERIMKAGSQVAFLTANPNIREKLRAETSYPVIDIPFTDDAIRAFLEGLYGA
ncbi:hypothetical protein [Rhizobium sp. NRK18]|uniref:hypothetical protein n=1 Tax=Rhizobium sp. NRK18 TaxID=2964667 RepID=UPI0021C3163E|nr:hypothetical protein [Rhizobium sp. NRK18]MCQ2002616.1 hypothetical protein [Rhizobium sp. NRK18]